MSRYLLVVFGGVAYVDLDALDARTMGSLYEKGPGDLTVSKYSYPACSMPEQTCLLVDTADVENRTSQADVDLEVSNAAEAMACMYMPADSY